MKNDPLQWERCLNIKAFYAVSESDFESLTKILDSESPFPKASEWGNVGPLVDEVLEKAELVTSEFSDYLHEVFVEGSNLDEVLESIKQHAEEFIKTSCPDNEEE